MFACVYIEMYAPVVVASWCTWSAAFMTTAVQQRVFIVHVKMMCACLCTCKHAFQTRTHAHKHTRIHKKAHTRTNIQMRTSANPLFICIPLHTYIHNIHASFANGRISHVSIYLSIYHPSIHLYFTKARTHTYTHTHTHTTSSAFPFLKNGSTVSSMTSLP